MTPTPSYLIVNADDYGYFNCVSKGILDSARYGIVTATGIFANSSQFNKHVDQLLDEKILDFGVHLNLTDQVPLTPILQEKLSRWSGHFPDKYTIVRLILMGVLTANEVETEWRTQIERCLDKGLDIRFINSHEHIHMLPSLFKVIHKLAAEYAIPHIRFPTPEMFQSLSFGGIIRDGSMKILALLNQHRLTEPPLQFVGMGESGKLSITYLKTKLSQLKPGKVYELMCHPGHFDSTEINNPKLLDYHDWQGEFDTLTNPEVREMLHAHNVRLIGYRHLHIRGEEIHVSDKLES